MATHLEISIVATGQEKSVSISISKKGNSKESANYHTIVLISLASNVLLKILPGRLQKYGQMYKLDLDKAGEPGIKLPTSVGS